MVNMARYGTSPSWKYLNTEPWAQVALPGRGFETLQDDGDLNRPFTVAGGDISDDDLIKIVTLIRSSRLKPGVPHLRDEGVYGTLPILRVIRRSPASVVVMLFVQDVTYQFVHLSQSGNDWSVDYVLTMVE
jgi:hypothetical protein